MVLKRGHFGKYIGSTWEVLKSGAGDGWKGSVGQIVLKMKQFYIEPRRTGIPQIQFKKKEKG